MNAIVPGFPPDPVIPGRALLPSLSFDELENAAVPAMDATWAALLDASIALAALAGIEPEPVQPKERYFPAMIRAIGGWRAEMAESNIADLAAIMEPGLAALLTAKARGAKTGPAAQSLWQEFQEARAALLALIPNNDVAGKRQSA